MILHGPNRLHITATVQEDGTILLHLDTFACPAKVTRCLVYLDQKPITESPSCNPK